jgi:signal transduction histidine kinase
VNARNERQDLTAKVEHDAVAFASLAQGPLASRAPRAVAQLRDIAVGYAGRTKGRVVVVGPRGAALVDSGPVAGDNRNFANRPEIAAALRGRIVSGTRFSDTLGESLLYVAAPVASAGTIRGAVRITYPTSAVDDRIRRYWLILAAIAGVVLAGAAVVAAALARSVTGPLRRLERAADAIGAGELETRAPVEGPPEVRALALAFNDTAGKLESLLRTQEAFVADASHQLRTPLTALRLRLENLELDVAPAGRAGLERALAETERLNRLVDALLVLARAERGDVPEEPLDAGALVDARAEAWSALAEERGVELRGAARDGDLLARGTPDRLEQVLDNLLENALEVTPRGAAIHLHARRRDGTVELHVVDEGPGLSAEARERAFDRFWRGRGSGEGSGLGLAIARRLVEADGGTIELREAPSGGIDAVVRLQSAH